MITVIVDNTTDYIDTPVVIDGSMFSWEEAEDIYNKLEKILWERDRQQSARYQAGFTEDDII